MLKLTQPRSWGLVLLGVTLQSLDFDSDNQCDGFVS
jgi:hypothetical protein